MGRVEQVRRLLVGEQVVAGRTYTIRVCPECGEQETAWPESAGKTFCLNHDDEPWRDSRPAHVRVEVAVVDAAEVDGRFPGWRVA